VPDLYVSLTRVFLLRTAMLPAVPVLMIMYMTLYSYGNLSGMAK
jgi:hypothetical protein